MEFPQDNIQVWAVIRNICLGGPAWRWVSRYARQANGRDTYLALKGHYLGEAYISRMHTSADKTLETAFYDGRSRNFTYEKYCEILIQAFNDVKEAGEDVAEKRKMQSFLKGLNDPCYEAAKHTIRVTPNLRNSIANTMDLVAGVLWNIANFTNPACPNVSVQESLRVPTEGGRGGGRGCGSRGGRGGRGGYGGGRGSNAMSRNDEIINRY